MSLPMCNGPFFNIPSSYRIILCMPWKVKIKEFGPGLFCLLNIVHFITSQIQDLMDDFQVRSKL